MFQYVTAYWSSTGYFSFRLTIAFVSESHSGLAEVSRCGVDRDCTAPLDQPEETKLEANEEPKPELPCDMDQSDEGAGCTWTETIRQRDSATRSQERRETTLGQRNGGCSDPRSSHKLQTRSSRLQWQLHLQLHFFLVLQVLVLSAHCSAVAASEHLPQRFLPASRTQFELAMIQTLQGVREGTLPDPDLRRPDGTQGTLLDALLPRQKPTGVDWVNARRRLDSPSKRNSLTMQFPQGAPYSAFNMSYFRYSSVNPAASVDWRNTSYNTPLWVQSSCASCWVGAPADTIAMAYAIARRSPPLAPSVQQFCDCGGIGCCKGGWPEVAFSWYMAQGNVTTNSFYPYWATDTNRKCNVTRGYPIAGSLTGWERVPMFSQVALMKAVSMQPVMVYISASADDFNGYNSTAPGTPGFYIYNGNCTTQVNHVVVVVGYNTLAPTPYWIIKNSWATWGDNGYMYLTMSGDGPGTCGMLSGPPLYPAYFPNAPNQLSLLLGSTTPTSKDDYWWNTWKPTGDPCANIINPCGSGTCYNASGIARCNCTAPYVELLGAPTSKCVDPSPCTSSQSNPCGPGACLDIGDGGYICGCPTGYVVGAQMNGNPTCVATPQNGNTSYVTQFGDSCEKLKSTLKIEDKKLSSLNPYLNCKAKMLPPGLVVTVPASSLPGCMQVYAARPGDTCQVIAYNMDRNSTFLSMLNASFWGYNSSTACASNSTTPTNSSKPSTSPPQQASTSPSNSTCVPAPTLLFTVPKISLPLQSYPLTNFSKLNPTVSCKTPLFASQLVCVKAAPSTSARGIQCGLTYTTVAGDTCASIQSSYGLNSSYFQQLNPGIKCKRDDKMYLPAGIQICVGPSKNSSSSVSNCSKYYSIQQGDSCTQIWAASNLSQFQFLYINPGLQCQEPYLYVGQQVCINSSALANISDPNYIVYTVQPNDSLPIIQSKFVTKCQSFSIALDRIARQNGVSDWTKWSITNGTIIIPCVPNLGAQCGCVPSLTVCGADFVNYPSYCDATCNFASPIKNGACTTCQSACAGRYGTTPRPASACPAGYTCPYPTWPPIVTDASKVYTCTTTTGGKCMCLYRQQTCSKACANYANTVGGTASTCYNACYCCAQVPCGGPSVTSSAGTGFCTGGCSAGNFPCNPFGRTCQVNCNYWNSWWQTNSKTVPAYLP